jgi:geranylgeranyl diphosphate synthase, type II
MLIDKYLTEKARLINEYLDKNLLSADNYPAEIYQAMRYSVFAGGKRIRPVLTLATGEMLNSSIKKIIPIAAAIELIHTYSLIHDDLPSMDNDDFRRGKPTSHKKYGEATAILAGNALLMAAFDLVVKRQKKYRIHNNIVVQELAELAVASGYAGMVGGQIVDLESENKTVKPNTLNYIHIHKTGALICISIRLGAIISLSTVAQLKSLTNFGNTLGLMFQITDDILDELDNRTQLNKIGKRDRALGKATYPSIYGLEQSKEKVIQLLTDSKKYLEPFGQKTALLVAIAELVAKRIN